MCSLVPLFRIANAVLATCVETEVARLGKDIVVTNHRPDDFVELTGVKEITFEGSHASEILVIRLLQKRLSLSVCHRLIDVNRRVLLGGFAL